MATQISLDLIYQLQVSLRKDAKLFSFDHVGDYTDSSFHNLPTAAEAIAELDASAPYLRCRDCKGKLLRGIESLICVFCGKQQRTSDNPPDPIKFNSTFAYKWFLSTLNLDGSEMVEPLKETTRSSIGAKKPVVKGIALSKFLDLEIRWSEIVEKSINSGPGDEQSMQKENPLNLGGLNLDDLFVEGRGDLSKVDPAENKPEEDDFKDPRSLSLFDSVQSQGVVESQQNANVDLFKGKEAQKNVSSGEHENLSLFAERDVRDSVSLAEQENFGFFQGKDAQRNSSKGDENLGLFEGEPSSNAGLKFFDEKIVASSSDWNSDFQSADHIPTHDNISGDPFVGSPVDLATHKDSVIGSGKDFLYDKPAVSKAGDWLQGDLFGNVTGKTQNNDPAVPDKYEGQVVGSNESSSMDIDWLGDDLWQTTVKKPTEKTTTNDNDDEDDWDNFASSANSKTPKNPLSQTVESPQEEIFDSLASVKNNDKEQSKDEKQNTAPSMISDIAKGQEDDLFGNWDSFTSSTPVQPHTNHMNPEMDLFGENNNHQDLDSDFFSESINSKEVKSMPSDGKDQTLDLVGTTTTSHKSKSDVAEEVMSQMHDLSLMLETKHSVPPISKT